jgi:cytochrome c556
MVEYTQVRRVAAPWMLALALLFTGCGGGGSNEDDAVEQIRQSGAKQQIARDKIALLEAVKAGESETTLELKTQTLIDDLEEHEDRLGEDMVREEIDDTIESVGPFCSTCRGMLRDARP